MEVSKEGLQYVSGQWGRFTICKVNQEVYHMLGP